MRSIQIICLLAISFSLGILIYTQSAKSSSLINEITISNDVLTLPDSIRAEMALEDLVNNIVSEEKLESKYIGYGGVRSSQPDYTKLLTQWANIEQLIKLTNDGNALVKVLAFEALVWKKYSGVKQIFEGHLYDQQKVLIQSGCEVISTPVNITFFRHLEPSLNPAEKGHYKNELLKQYKETFFEYRLRY